MGIFTTMTDIAIVQHYADGKTAKEIGALYNKSTRCVEKRLVKMKAAYFAVTVQHLVAIFLRRGIIE